jgi:hypothetical protein
MPERMNPKPELFIHSQTNLRRPYELDEIPG